MTEELKIIQINIGELMVRMLEANQQAERPVGVTPQQFLGMFPEDDMDRLQRMAMAACHYIVERQAEAYGKENVTDLIALNPAGMN